MGAGAIVTITNKGIYLKASVTLPIVKQLSIYGQLTLLSKGNYQLAATLMKKINLPGMTSGSGLTDATVTFSKSSVALAAKASLFALGTAKIAGEITADGQYAFAASLDSPFKISKLGANLFTASVALSNSGIGVRGTVNLPIGKATFNGLIDAKGKYAIAAQIKTFKIAGLSQKAFTNVEIELSNSKVSFSAGVTLPKVLGSALVSGTISADNLALHAELNADVPKLGKFLSTGLVVDLDKSHINVAARVKLPVFGTIQLTGTVSTAGLFDLKVDLAGKRGLGGFSTSLFPKLLIEFNGSAVGVDAIIHLPIVGRSCVTGSIRR